MKKIFFGVVLLAVVIGITFFFLSREKGEQQGTDNEPSATFPTGTGTNQTGQGTDNPEPFPVDIELDDEESTISLRGADGSTFEVPNFIANGTATKDPYNLTNYKMGEKLSGVSTGEYSFTITFIESSRFFNISLNSEPLRKSRQEAETYLQEVLKINLADMCSLDYMLSVPGFVNEEYSGMNLRFSFCPGAVALP